MGAESLFQRLASAAALWRRSVPPRWFLATALAFAVLAFLVYGHSGPDDVYITYWPARALAEHGRIWNECLSDGDRQLLASHGYRVVYNQVGTVRDIDDNPLLPAQIGACGYFAVREDLAQKLGLGPERVVVWDSDPR